MSKLRLTAVTLFATGIMLTLSTTTANAQPSPTSMAQARAANYCSDPWITTAIWFVTGGIRNPAGVGTTGECDPQLYNGGTWNSYNQLTQAVGATLSAISSQGASISLRDIGGNRLQVITNLGGGVVATATVSGHIVNTNGSNIVASGAGNVVSNDGGSIVASGAGNFHTLSVGQKSLKLPNNRLLVVTRGH